MPHTHFKTAIYNSNEGAGNIKASLNLGDGALHVGSAKGFGKVCKGHRGQEELETHRHTQYTVRWNYYTKSKKKNDWGTFNLISFLNFI